VGRKRRPQPEPDLPAAATARAEPAPGGSAAAMLALALFVAPAVGVPAEEMLQDTLKSILVSFAALAAAFLLVRQLRTPGFSVRWHAVLWLPLMLMAYALGSIAWSHGYLAGVEAVRWFVFALLAWVALNVFTRERLPMLAWGIHGGAVVASFWAALQFWADLSLFPQGPNPGSTFVNRNFFAEFVVCTLPFSALLLARAKRSSAIALLAASNGLVITAILMTGTRAALIALWLQLLIVWPLIAWRCRAALPLLVAPRAHRMLAAGALVLCVAGLGSIPSGNPKVLAEARGETALARGIVRTQSIGPRDHSLGIRMVMWKATLGMLHAHPLAGVGAGAWESEIPLYQAEGSQLETDYYVHNEYLQLVAEYGLVGWIFLGGLAALCLRWAARTWRDDEVPLEERLWRSVLLCALLAFFVVSSIGFPWRMAATGALFALCLGALAASDLRLGREGRSGGARLPWPPAAHGIALGALTACVALGAYITWRAAQAEWKLVRAAKLSLMVTSTGQPGDPRWASTRDQIVRLAREGVALNPHYRKITPMVADELAKWGDWANATWIWESVLSSRPNIVVILCNAARGHVALGDEAGAFALLERARAIQPRASGVVSLEVVLLARAGRADEAITKARAALIDGYTELDLLNVAAILGWRAGDLSLAVRAMELKVEHWPQHRAAAYLELGKAHAQGGNAVRAEAAFRDALNHVPPGQQAVLLGEIPHEYRKRLQPAGAAAPQRSSSSP
jgi:O-antigen ligase